MQGLCSEHNKKTITDETNSVQNPCADKNVCRIRKHKKKTQTQDKTKRRNNKITRDERAREQYNKRQETSSAVAERGDFENI